MFILLLILYAVNAFVFQRECIDVEHYSIVRTTGREWTTLDSIKECPRFPPRSDENSENLCCPSDRIVWFSCCRNWEWRPYFSILSSEWHCTFSRCEDIDF